MFVYIQEVKTKTPSKGSRKGIEVIRKERVIKGIERVVYGFEDSKERFERPLKPKYKVMVAHSYREDGKVKKLTVSLGQFSYYDLLDGERFECWGVENKLKEKGIPYSDDVESIVYEKVRAIEEKILEELRMTDEYQTYKKLSLIESNYYEARFKFRDQYGEDLYDCFYDIYGEIREFDLLQEYKKEFQKRKEEQEAYERRSREESFERWFNSYTSASNSPSNFSNEELEVVRQIISAGFKKVATKYHPDRGGTDEQMKMLNNINDKLKGIYG